MDRQLTATVQQQVSPFVWFIEHSTDTALATRGNARAIAPAARGTRAVVPETMARHAVGGLIAELTNCAVDERSLELTAHEGDVVVFAVDGYTPPQALQSSDPWIPVFLTWQGGNRLLRPFHLAAGKFMRHNEWQWLLHRQSFYSLAAQTKSRLRNADLQGGEQALIKGCISSLYGLARQRDRNWQRGWINGIWTILALSALCGFAYLMAQGAEVELFLRPLFACMGLSGALSAAVLWVLSR